MSSPLEGLFQQRLADAATLVFVQNAHGAEGEWLGNAAVIVKQARFCIHPVDNGFPVKLAYIVRHGDEVGVRPKNVRQMMFAAARNIQVPEYLSVKDFHGAIIRWRLVVDMQVWLDSHAPLAWRLAAAFLPLRLQTANILRQRELERHAVSERISAFEGGQDALVG